MKILAGPRHGSLCANGGDGGVGLSV